MADKDLDFLLACVVNTPAKPDFEEVAKQLGLPSSKTAYHRHWSLMKKHGLAGNSGKGRQSGSSPSSSKVTKTPTSAKRGKASNKSKKAAAEVDHDESEDMMASDNDKIEVDTTPATKAKSDKKVKKEKLDGGDEEDDAISVKSED